MWLYLYRTRGGLILRAVEQPNAAFARGSNVVLRHYIYTLIGGALMGIGGAAFSLDFKAGWSYRHTAGYGWCAGHRHIWWMESAAGNWVHSCSAYCNHWRECSPGQIRGVNPGIYGGALCADDFGVGADLGQWLDRLLITFPADLRRSITKGGASDTTRLAGPAVQAGLDRQFASEIARLRSP